MLAGTFLIVALVCKRQQWVSLPFWVGFGVFCAYLFYATLIYFGNLSDHARDFTTYKHHAVEWQVLANHAEELSADERYYLVSKVQANRPLFSLSELIQACDYWNRSPKNT